MLSRISPLEKAFHAGYALATNGRLAELRHPCANNSSARGRFFLRPLCLPLLVSCAALPIATKADDAFAPDSRWMTGDWGGVRNDLRDKGYDLTLDHKAEVGWNAQGGYDQDRTARYADQYVFGLGMNLEKILGWSSAKFQLTVTDRNGRDITADKLIDRRGGQLSSSMEVYGRGQMWHLTEMAYRQTLFNGATDARIGRFGPDEFGAFPCDFQNLMFCGNTGGAWAGAVWYNFPISQWAFQLKQKLGNDWSIMAGVFEQNPSLLENDTGFKLNLSGGKGVLLPAEVIYTPPKGLFGLPGEYRVGGFLSTAGSEDVFKGSDGQPQVLTPGSGFESHGSRHGFWTVLRQQAWLLDDDRNRPVEVFAFGHVNDRDSNYIRSSVSMGVTVTGPFESRPNDQVAFAVGRLKVNPRFSERQRMLNVMSGETDYASVGYQPVQDKEYTAELYYGIQATRWLTIRPNLQYIRHPGGVDEVDDALVVGLKVMTRI